jgi:hypothetical protein
MQQPAVLVKLAYAGRDTSLVLRSSTVLNYVHAEKQVQALVPSEVEESSKYLKTQFLPQQNCTVSLIQDSD